MKFQDSSRGRFENITGSNNLNVKMLFEGNLLDFLSKIIRFALNCYEVIVDMTISKSFIQEYFDPKIGNKEKFMTSTVFGYMILISAD